MYPHQCKTLKNKKKTNARHLLVLSILVYLLSDIIIIVHIGTVAQQKFRHGWSFIQDCIDESSPVERLFCLYGNIENVLIQGEKCTIHDTHTLLKSTISGMAPF